MVVFGLILAVSAQAQGVLVKNSVPDLRVEFKRCIGREGLAFFDLLITNVSQKDITLPLHNTGQINIYDDEGNLYSNRDFQGQRTLYFATSNTDSQPLRFDNEIPAGISYRMRIILSGGFDKYATKIQLLKISFGWRQSGTIAPLSWDAIEIRNIPITRE